MPLSVVIAFMATITDADAADMALEVTKVDGEKMFILLDKAPSISFPDENTICIGSDDGKMMYAYDEIDSYRIADYSSISDITVSPRQSVGFKIEENQILISGLMDNADVSLYSIDGQICGKGQMSIDDICRIPTAGLSHGVYLMTAGDFQCKIIL